MGPEEQRVYDALGQLGVRWTRYEHPAVHTVEEAQQHWASIPATHCKNLFLRNKKGSTHYLVVLEASKRADVGALAARLGEDRFSFASPERLQAHLGLTPGSVSPFGLINDRAKGVRVVIDNDLRRASTVAFHPNVNTATITVTWADFERFLAAQGHVVKYLTFPA